jgi:hypothetical protein
MKRLRTINEGLIWFLVPLVALLFTNATVNKHHHRWHGMLVEHAHPFKMPIQGQQHQHTDVEFALYDLLSLDKIDDQVVFLPTVDVNLVESSYTFATISSSPISSEFCFSRLRAPPVF